MGNGLPISRETFKTLPPEAKIDAVFDSVVHLIENGFEAKGDREEFRASCDARFKTLESSKGKDRGIAALMGVIAGASPEGVRSLLSKLFGG
jgi:hypothetical protein